MPRYCYLLIFALTLSMPAQAQVYKWVDANGQTHFGNQPPTPEQPVEAVKIRPGYEGTPQPRKANDPISDSAIASSTETTSSPDAQEEKPQSEQEMCSEAMRWTSIDISNLKEIAQQRLKDDEITRDQHTQALEALNQADDALSLSDCMGSEGEKREFYDCLSGGAGIMVCSGALEAAFKEAFKGL